MKKLSSVTGYPLRQTSPAAIEKELVARIRNDLGEFQDMALIQPMLRVDKEDGDLSGNVTNGYGVIVVKVIKKALLVPFIIHGKQLLPFDVIQMGEQQVSYDMAKLRKLVVQLDKVQREQATGEGGDGEVFEKLVDFKEVPTHNGFLGTIMNLRDEYTALDNTGAPLYSGDNFGLMDDMRIERKADVADLFEDFHEKLADVQVFSEALVKETAEKIQGRFEKEAQDAILSHKEAGMTKEAAEIKRNIEMLEQDTLKDASVAKSGNNIAFPIRSGTTFEKRLGRVYHSIAPLVEPLKTDIKRIVLDNRGHFSFLTGKDKFMVEDKNPPHFEMPTKVAASLETGHLYAIEKDQGTLYAPFRIESAFGDIETEFLYATTGSGQMKLNQLDDCRTIREVYTGKQEFSSSTLGKRFADTTFVLVVLKDSKEPFAKMTYQTTEDLINRTETSADGMRIAKYAVERMMHIDTPIYIVGEYTNAFFPLVMKMEGHFTKPDGYFEEGFAFEKSAAYEKNDKARLYVQSQNPPRYSLEWTFASDASDDEEGMPMYQMEKRMQRNLTPDQAKGLLTQLGYDERQKEMFFQISTRNGRMAEFKLPNVELAKNLAPEDKGRSKAAEFVRGLVDTSLNANNFLPGFKDTITSNLSDAAVAGLDSAFSSHKGGIIRDAVAKVLDKEAEHSLFVAQELEKVAESLRGAHWVEVAQLANVKHHMDKLAAASTSGFVKEAEHVFGILPSFEPSIAKCAKELTMFNREQLMRQEHNIVSGELVKEAIHQLDGLYRYASLAKNLGNKLNFFREAPSIKQGLEQLDGDYARLEELRKQEMNQLRSVIVDLRVAKRQGVGPDELANIENKANAHFDTANQLLKQIGQNRYEHGALIGKRETDNRIKTLGAMVPLAGAFGAGTAAIGTE